MLKHHKLSFAVLTSLMFYAIASGPVDAQTKPTVVSTDPANGATNVSRSLSQVHVTFSKAMSANIDVGSNGWGASQFSWLTDKKVLTTTRNDAGMRLPPLRKISFTLGPGLKDIDGNSIDPYSFSFTTAGANLQKIAANPQKGFSWPYYLLMPSAIKNPAVMMVEPNNTGTTNDDPAVHDAAALNLINARESRAEDLGCPILVPTFPRPATDWRVYTQALDRDTLQTTLPNLARIDLQLIAMIDDARTLLAQQGTFVDAKVWMIGYSASASFAGRFTILHPDRIKAVSTGSGGSYPIVPVSVWKGKTLRYPVGVADLQQLVGQPFNAAVFRTVPLQIYIGDQDLNDALNYTDGYDPEDAALIKELFGGPPPFMRYPGVESAYASIHSSTQFVVFPGMAHQWPDWAFLKEFFERNRTEPFPPPLPTPLLYKIYFPHVASFGPYDTEIGLTNTSEATVSGILHAYTKDGGQPLESHALTIAPSGRQEITASRFFQNPQSAAYLIFESSSGFVAGYTRFSQPGNRASLAAGKGSKAGWFAKVEKDGWTGIAFVNTETTIATVNLTAWDANGNQVGAKTITLQPGEKSVGMVDQLFGSNVSDAVYVKFASDKTLLGFTVSGSGDGTMLDGLHSLGQYVY